MYVNVSVDESFSSESQNLRGINPFDPVYSSFFMFVQSQSNLIKFDQVKMKLIIFDQTWTSLIQFALVWSSLIKYDQV